MTNKELENHINKNCTVTFKNGSIKDGKVKKVGKVFIINGGFQLKPSEIKSIQSKISNNNGFKYTVVSCDKIEDNIEKVVRTYKKTGENITRYQVRCYITDGKQVVRQFTTLEEAQQFKSICKANINKIKFSQSMSNLKEIEKINNFNEYPETLLAAIDIVPEEYNNYYDEIVPNFDVRFNEIRKYLRERELMVLELRFKQYKSLEQVGKELGVTRERIRQIEAKAIRKLSHPSCKNIIVKNQEKLELISSQERAEMLEKIKSEMTLELAREIIANHNKVETETHENKHNIRDLDLTVRSYNCLVRACIETTDDLIKMIINAAKKSSYCSSGDTINARLDVLLKVRNLGRKSMKEVVEKFKESGVDLDKLEY